MGVAGYGTMAQLQWRGHDGTGTMALAQAHLHRHDGTVARKQLQGTMAQARFYGHNSTGTMASARWLRHGECRDVYSRKIHALSEASLINRFSG